MNKEKHVLVINTIGLSLEGISSVIYNYSIAMDRSGLQFDYITFEDVDAKIKEKFEKLGRVITVPNRKQHVLKYIAAMMGVLSEGYDIVHIHGNSGTMAIEAFLCRVHRIQNIIVHCHNTTCNHPIVNNILSPIMIRLSDYLLCCSEESGEWLYKSKPHIVLNNAIDIDAYSYNDSIRKEYRERFCVNEDVVVLGHVGRFSEQKNHRFVIDIIEQYRKINDRFLLLLVGIGPDMDAIREQVSAKGLQDNVLFLGERNDINLLYSAMDLFILPSKWEGLPVVLLEAQASGLPALVSDVVTKEARCTNGLYFYSLEKSAEDWAKRVHEIISNPYPRFDAKDVMYKTKFNIKNEAEKLRAIYLSRES